MIPVFIAAAGVVIVLGPVAWLVRTLALRVVGVKPRRKVITVRRVGEDLELPQTVLTAVAGNYGLWFGEGFKQHALVGPVVRSDDKWVVRRLLEATAPVPAEPFQGQWTGHVMHSPAQIDGGFEDISVPLRDGTSAPAWLFRGDSADGPWVIHVQGIRTSRLVILRSVEVAERLGLTSLAITYRGSGDGPEATVSSLGQREWSDLGDAVSYARSHGARFVYIAAWSMGAGIALELNRRDPRAFDRLVLIAPATDWRAIIRHGVEHAGLPGFLAPIVSWVLGSQAASRMLGLPEPLDFDLLDWKLAEPVSIPTLVVHSEGDQEIPFELTKAFAAAHPKVTVVETTAAPHGWEANVDPQRFQSALESWLVPQDGE